MRQELSGILSKSRKIDKNASTELTLMRKNIIEADTKEVSTAKTAAIGIASIEMKAMTAELSEKLTKLNT